MTVYALLLHRMYIASLKLFAVLQSVRRYMDVHDCEVACNGSIVGASRHSRSSCILHNDIKSNNVHVHVPVTDKVVAGSLDFQVVVIDFVKTKDIDKGRCYYLSDVEKSEYTPQHLG